MKNIELEIARREGIQAGLETAMHLIKDKDIQMDLLDRVKKLEKKIELLKNKMETMRE